jgi:hypothetical protein
MSCAVARCGSSSNGDIGGDCLYSVKWLYPIGPLGGLLIKRVIKLLADEERWKRVARRTENEQLAPPADDSSRRTAGVHHTMLLPGEQSVQNRTPVLSTVFVRLPSVTATGGGESGGGWAGAVRVSRPVDPGAGAPQVAAVACGQPRVATSLPCANPGFCRHSTH